MQDLLARLSSLNVRVEVAEGQLRVNAPAGVLTPELQRQIATHKEALIERLRSASASADVERAEDLPPIVPEPSKRHEPFPLSDVQHAYWIGRTAHIELGGVASHLYLELECGALDPHRLNESFRAVVAAHGMLRAVVDPSGQQRVLETVPPYEVRVDDVRDVGRDRRDTHLERIRAEMSHQVFAADRWPLFDVRLVLLSDRETRLCVSWDFLVMDAWSLMLVFEQWFRLYTDPRSEVAAPALSFRDYVLTVARLKETPAYQRAKKYWWDRLDDLPPAPQLPVRRRIEVGRKHTFSRRRLHVPAREWEAIQAFGRRSGLTPTSVLLAVFSQVLSRWAQTPHYCLNLTLFNRLPLHPEVDEIVGDFTTMMALEVDARRPAPLVDRARQLQAQFLKDFEHRRVGAVEIFREVTKRRGWQQKAVLPVVFTSTLVQKEGRPGVGDAIERFGRVGFGISQTPQVWLDSQVFEAGGDLVINWDAAAAVFLPGVLDDMFEAHRALLSSLSTPGAWQQRDVPLPPTQRDRRAAVNATGADVVAGCLHEPFVARALEHPAARAVVSSAGEMSYGELLAHSAALAGQLRERGVGPNELVAVVMEKGPEQIVAVLGVLIAGAAYLPIEPRWPALRRTHLLEHGEARIALTQAALRETLSWPDGVEPIVVRPEAPRPLLTGAPPVRQSAGDLAYVIFTSGSTGTPKGVMIDHRGAVNTVAHVSRLFGVGPGAAVLAVSDLSFDLSVYDIFGLLAAGGAVVIPDGPAARDPSAWADLMRRHGVTVWNSAPPLMGMLVDALEDGPPPDASSLRLVMLSGDWIPLALPDRVRASFRAAHVVSLGGATEGSIWSISYPIGALGDGWDSVPYGKALPNQHMYVLNRQLEPCPDLVVGDIYIGGLGVALGYWKDPDRTAAQFMAHPATGERLYFTGDLGRVHPDGNIEFLGRSDSQVKLRGHRVELGEISACLQSHPGVREAVAQVVKNDGRAALTAYVVADSSVDSGLFAAVAAGDSVQSAAAAVAEAGRDTVERADRDGLRVFWEFWRAVDRACVRGMFETIRALGIPGAADAAVRVEELVRGGRVQPSCVPLVHQWLDALVASGHLQTRGGSYEPGSAAQADEDLDRQLAGIERTYGADPRLSGFAEHAARSLRQHLPLLSGEVNALALLFPEGSPHVAEALARVNPIARHHNDTVAAILRGLIGAWAGDRRLRVLEIGAGSGSTTASLLAECPPERTEFWFTDVSPYFFSQGREKFAGYPFVRYSTFDINKDPKSQRFQPHTYDAIVSANALHNAKDLTLALNHVRELLRPGGYLLLLEGTSVTPWFWATVAFLTMGHADASRDTEIVEIDEWRRSLASCGFGPVQVFPPEADGSALSTWLTAMPQHVVAAQAPATVRCFQEDVLAEYLRERLPDHMIPQRFVLLDRLPLTANGKIDMAALPTDAASSRPVDRSRELPASDTEDRILRIWQQVLGVEELSVTDNFFDVGGDSLLITEVLRRVNKETSASLAIAELFSHPTIRSLAAYVGGGAPVERRPAPRPHRDRSADEAAGIAVIGMAGRFPDARNVDELWQNVAPGKCAVRQFTEAELLEAGVSREELAQRGYVKAGVVLDGMDLFDAAFFGITPREAEVMDPQQRFLLECAVDALEDGGYPHERHGGRIGVFVGKGISLYLLHHLLPDPEIVATLGFMPIMNLNEKDFAAPIVSYRLNLTGPSVSVNTGCSTSLVAVHLACRSLLDGECEIALAGGVSFVSTSRASGYRYHEGHIASPDGFCRPFSDDATGTVFGSGVGLVVLKPLAAALRDGDTVHAVIRGSAINNDGSMKVGFTAPSLRGQADVIAAALDRAGLAADAVQMVEAHGTGTHLGDPIEFGALRQVFGGPRADGSRCALGSIKSNVGHLDSAAGVTGLIKAVQALRHAQIPPTLFARVPNRAMDFADSPFYLAGDLAGWNANGAPRVAGVSSFGVGGTNAHVVVTEAPAQAPPGDDERPQLLVVSAKNERSLRRMVQELDRAIARGACHRPADVAWTLQAGRNEYSHRSFAVCDTLADASREFANRRTPIVHVPHGAPAQVAFLFPGQGSQRPDATWRLYETQPAFRAALDECADLVRSYTGADLRAWLYTAERHPGQSVDLDQTAVTHPVLFSVEYALARWWESLGIRPAAMLGHSLGEYAAACVAGVFSLAEALSLVVVRGQLLQGLEPGRMLAVSCGEEQLAELLARSNCSLAAVNGPAQCVASGSYGDIDALQRDLARVQIPSRVLQVSHAFHSSMVDPILETFERCVSEVRRNRPVVPFVSNVTGTWMTDEDAVSPAYWAQHLRRPVRFDQGLDGLLGMSRVVLLEVGPGRTLSTFAARKHGAGRAVPTIGDAPEAEVRTLLEAVGTVWQHGVEIDWPALHAGRPRRRVPLPTYAFDRKRFWIERRGRIGAPAHAAPAEAAAAPAPEPADPSGYERPALPTAYVPARDELEATLVDIWQAYLGVRGIGVHDSFVALGGDSLMATRLHAHIQREFGVELPIGKMLEFATIRRMALYITVVRDPANIDRLSAEELDDCLGVLEG